MEQTNIDVLGINFLVEVSNQQVTGASLHVSSEFLASPWYKDIIYVLKNLQVPP